MPCPFAMADFPFFLFFNLFFLFMEGCYENPSPFPGFWCGHVDAFPMRSHSCSQAVPSTAIWAAI
ncbi:hypothetical protein M758_UG196700 [Ceratodon purpureus]|nr:hypothetical protein M758_UG196700 [Ceratodon purpureus]